MLQYQPRVPFLRFEIFFCGSMFILYDIFRISVTLYAARSQLLGTSGCENVMIVPTHKSILFLSS